MYHTDILQVSQEYHLNNAWYGLNIKLRTVCAGDLRGRDGDEHSVVGVGDGGDGEFAGGDEEVPGGAGPGGGAGADGDGGGLGAPAIREGGSEGDAAAASAGAVSGARVHQDVQGVWVRHQSGYERLRERVGHGPPGKRVPGRAEVPAGPLPTRGHQRGPGLPRSEFRAAALRVRPPNLRRHAHCVAHGADRRRNPHARLHLDAAR